jgi:hypothetical protein
VQEVEVQAAMAQAQHQLQAVQIPEVVEVLALTKLFMSMVQLAALV